MIESTRSIAKVDGKCTLHRKSLLKALAPMQGLITPTLLRFKVTHYVTWYYKSRRKAHAHRKIIWKALALLQGIISIQINNTDYDIVYGNESSRFIIHVHFFRELIVL